MSDFKKPSSTKSPSAMDRLVCMNCGIDFIQAGKYAFAGAGLLYICEDCIELAYDCLREYREEIGKK